jgi:hypothetical protein
VKAVLAVGATGGSRYSTLARRPGRRSLASARNATTSVEGGGVPEKVLKGVSTSRPRAS